MNIRMSPARLLRLLTKASQLSREFHDVGHRDRKPAIRIEGMIRRRREYPVDDCSGRLSTDAAPKLPGVGDQTV